MEQLSDLIQAAIKAVSKDLSKLEIYPQLLSKLQELAVNLYST